MTYAIETRYAGSRFRSRREARGAVFFDALGMPWEYEPEGYRFRDGTLYLPDFWLPEQQVWVEVKGADPTEAECRKAELLAKATGKPVLVFFGPLFAPSDERDPWAPEAYHFFVTGGCDRPYLWCECHHCGKIGAQFDGRSNRLPCKQTGCVLYPGHEDKGYNYNSSRLMAAYAAMLGARFEQWGDVA